MSGQAVAEGQRAIRLKLTGRIAVAGEPEETCLAQVALARIAGPDTIHITTEAQARRGQVALCHLERVGVIPGRIGTASAAGFLLIPDLCDARRERVMARLAWLIAPDGSLRDQRGTPRIVPVHRAVMVRLSDGPWADGEIEDLSKTGARIRFPSGGGAPQPWLPGLPVTVGKRYAVVVRAEDGVIAVRFRLPFTDETFNPGVVL